MKDLLIKSAKLINGEIVDIEVDRGKILSFGNLNLNENEFKNVVDLKSKHYISAGWIDIHTHCFDKFELYSDEPDNIGYNTGVTTVVDAGTTGACDIDEFYKKSQTYKTNVYAFINISKVGIKNQDELSDLNNIDENMLKSKLEIYSNFIVGIKARMSKSVVGNTGNAGLIHAKHLCKDLNVPLMVHIGTEPPILNEILNVLEKGDIVSHIYNSKPNGILDSNKNVKQEVIYSYERGVLFDVAHGKDSFNFEVAKIATDIGIKPYTISTDIYKRNRINGPVFNLATTMSKFVYLGYSAENIIDMVTVNPANAIDLKSKGKIDIGYDADFTIFDIKDESRVLTDSNGNSVESQNIFCPVAVVLNGEYIQI